MSAPKVGESLPADTTFSYVPYSPENADIKACGIPVPYNASKGELAITSISLPQYLPSTKPFNLYSLQLKQQHPELTHPPEWANKKVVLFSVPGAFTPTCSVRHLPDYIAKLPALRAKGVDIVAVLASNDPFVMSAWAKTSGITDEILFLSDTDTKFSNQFGWAEGGRTNRYAIILDKGVIRYAARETVKGEVSVSGVDNILEQLE